MKRFKVLALCVLMTLPIFVSGLFAQEKAAGNYTKSYVVDANGDLLQVMRWAGRKPADYVPETSSEKDAPKAIVKLSNVPGYSWSHGCTATATAMFVGYYDHFGATGCYTGRIDGGVAPMTNAVWASEGATDPDSDGCALAASEINVDGRSNRGHHDDYWSGYENEGDPYYDGLWAQHDHYVGQPCTADFMGTNQWYNWGNVDGSTSVYNYLAPSGAKLFDCADSPAAPPDQPYPGRDATHGMRLFFESLGIQVQQNFNQVIEGYIDPDYVSEGPVVGGYTYDDYKRSIDQGRPVLIHIIGHTMLGYGYDDGAGTDSLVYCRNTWSMATTDLVSFKWGTSYSGMDHQSMSEIILDPQEYYAVPENVLALNNNRTVTVTWLDMSDSGSRGVTYQVFRDGVQVGTPTTNSYQETLSSAYDGVHYYKVKAVYTDASYTTGFSDQSGVYVCESVTSFSDTFENTWAAQWLFTPATGETGGWGRDTAYHYAGSYSLSDSPGGDYVNNTVLYSKGGSVAEVAPGLNFSDAWDCKTTFYLRYEIEESFDYLYYQFTEDGVNWITLKYWSLEPETPAFGLETIKHGHLAGKPNIRFRFILVTDQGYVTEGANIDNFSITPEAEDTTPPFVYYTNNNDWYSECSDGYEITTQIADRTGIDFARILYKVNGGTEVSSEPTTVNGEIYFWKLPVAPNAGDIVEFRFYCRDTVSPTKNEGFTGPWQYAEGLHLKYNYGTVSAYTYVVTTTNANDYKSMAVRFNSFHDDIVGAVIRGYTDATTEYEEGLNCDMMVNVWAESGDLPGATLITPFAVANPATLSNTNAWTYVDLSSYTSLDDMAASYFIGFEARTGQTGRTLCRTCVTNTGEALEYDFGRAYYQYYAVSGGSLTWSPDPGSNYHIRCVTTNNMVSPPVIEAPAPTFKSVAENSTGTEIVYVGNSGSYPLDYEASFTYDGYLSPGGDIHTNDFASFPGTGYTNSNWVSYNGGASATGNGVTSTLTSPSFDTSAITTDVYLAFDSNFIFRTGSWARVEYWTGSAWVQILNLTAASTVPQNIELPVKSSDTQIRFTAYTTRSSGVTARWTIDNIVVSNSPIPYSWLTLDGSATTSGSVGAGSTDAMTYGFDTAGLTLGQTYTATVTISDAEGSVDSKTTTVSLTVENTGGPIVPAVPSNIVTSIVGGQLFIQWDDAADAETYDVYTSADPYGTYTLLTNVAVSEYTYTGTETKMFFQIVSKNSTKESPKTIEVKAIKNGTVKR